MSCKWFLPSEGVPETLIPPFLRDDPDIKMLHDFKRRQSLNLPQNVLYKWMLMYLKNTHTHISIPNANDSIYNYEFKYCNNNVVDAYLYLQISNKMLRFKAKGFL